MRPRDGHHRSDQRTGPWATWRRRVACHLPKLFRCCHCLEALLAYDPPANASPAHQAARLRAKVALDAARPLMLDQDGRAWE